MARQLQIKRGPSARIPTFAQGEFGMATDSGGEKLFIGNGSTNLEVALIKDLTAAKVGAIASDLGSNYSITVDYGDHTYLATEVDNTVPNVPTSGSYAYFIISNRIGPMDAVLALPVSGTDKVYFYTASVKKWTHITSTDYAVTKTGSHVMSGDLTANAFVATDGYANVTIVSEGFMKRGEVRVTDRSTGENGSLLVTTSGLKWMDNDYNEYNVIHAGNVAQIMGAVPAEVE